MAADEESFTDNVIQLNVYLMCFMLISESICVFDFLMLNGVLLSDFYFSGPYSVFIRVKRWSILYYCKRYLL